ncbi:uncharacterized protein EI90DRAFT_3035835 [Cantharellus anzutake]|uniref:uncharacterized protein n=1 Tax=Cantharellus anzutake TaxID=1750568 RepID=UPI001903109C|nr:uncharacterized protein EI90DRAFT_3035835 [Cantharellus anzutake]KAF8340511.1 hypothetical protein EI90DRAFT_3035835 [Cantharellus anzutake]
MPRTSAMRLLAFAYPRRMSYRGCSPHWLLGYLFALCLPAVHRSLCRFFLSFGIIFVCTTDCFVLQLVGFRVSTWSLMRISFHLFSELLACCSSALRCFSLLHLYPGRALQFREALTPVGAAVMLHCAYVFTRSLIPSWLLYH